MCSRRALFSCTVDSSHMHLIEQSAATAAGANITTTHLVQGEQHVHHVERRSLLPLLADRAGEERQQVGVLQAAHDRHLLSRQVQLLGRGRQHLST